MRNALQYVRNVLRRIRNYSPMGPDYGTFKRLERAGRLTYGQGSYGIPKIMDFVLDTTGLRVAQYSSVGGLFILGGRHPSRMVTTYPHRINMRMEGAGKDGIPLPSPDTIVGSDCWVCMGSLIMTGVTIGDGAIVAAGAVVTKDVPPFAVVGGNPATVIRYRFTEEQIAALLDIRWWDWPEAEVREAVPYLASEDIEKFIAFARDKSLQNGRQRSSNS